MSRRPTSPALVLCCVDHRYIGTILRFVSGRLGAQSYDLKTDAGGVKALLKGNRAVRAWILSNLELAYRRHGVRKMVLVNHQDCAAYGGSVAFASSVSEAALHAEQLAQVCALLKSRFQGLHVQAFYAYCNREGIAFKRVGLRGRDK